MITLPKRRAPNAEPKTRTIRITYVIDNLSRAGTETQLLALIRDLDRSRFTPTLVLLNGDNSDSRNLEPANCDILRLGVTRLVGGKALAASWRLFRFWRRQKPDIGQFYFLDSAYYGIPIAKLAGIPLILRVRNNLGYWHSLKHRVLGSLVKPFVKTTLTNSEQGREALQTQDQLPDHRVHVIENGVDVERFIPRPGVPFRVACVANLRPVKNIDGLVRAFRRVVDVVPSATLHVAGDGEQRPALEQLIINLNLKAHVYLHGSVKEIPQFLQQAEVVVLPSHSEGMSNALLEAMAAGKAIVATDVGANARVLAGTGRVVPAQRDEALSEAIVNLLQDKDARVNLGLAARKRVEAEYSRRAMVARFETYYRNLMGNRPA